MPLDTSAEFVTRPERAEDACAFEALFDAAFGPGRFAKTAERVRERAAHAPQLSIGLWSDGRLVGAARQHRVRLGAARGAFLGPFAVAADRRGEGIGPRVIAAAAAASRAAGLDFVLLVGPQSYFAPLGFEPVARGAVKTPGAVDPARLLVHPLRVGVSLDGELTPDA